MKCKACNGRGVLVAPIYENDEIGFVDKTYQCYCCRGTGKIAQTNEEWFCALSTEEKARFLAVNKLNFDYQMWIEWLKEIHND